MALTDVFTFAHRPVTTATRRGTVHHLDPTIYEACIRLEGGEEVCVALDPQDCSEALQGIIREGGETVRIDCDVDEDKRCVQLYLMVDAACVDDELARGQLSAEEHVITLARSVWPDARVPAPCDPTPEAAPEDHVLPPAPAWRDVHSLFPHQRATVAWMAQLEASVPRRIGYAGNLRVTDRWYVDTESECFTRDASAREAQLAGGVCADGTGSGKTATLLRLVACVAEGASGPVGDVPYRSRGTLVIVPLNLVSQWQHEVQKFLDPAAVRVHFLLHGREIRALTLPHLCEADLVITTFHFLRASKGYLELIESALRGRGRTRPVLSSWTRDGSRSEPVLEAVHWRRVVVDELHETFTSPRDLRQLKLFTCDVLWGLTATPDLATVQAQHLYLLLRREKAHHPNLLTSIIQNAVRCHARTGTRAVGAGVTCASIGIPDPRHDLRLVQLSAEERVRLSLADGDDVDVADIVRRCTFDSLHPEGLATRRQSLGVKLEGQARLVRIMEGTAQELEQELVELATRCNVGEELAQRRLPSVRQACESHARDLAAARLCLDADVRRLERLESTDRLLRDRLAMLQRMQCITCGAARCDHLLRCCSLLVCRECIGRISSCPRCEGTLGCDMVASIPVVEGMHTKMTKIGELIASLNEPVILFVQWKAMMRPTRSFLLNLGLRVLLLDGNAAQRAATLAEFLSTGVLLICLEDSFAGLHLPHVHHIIFAHAIVGDRRQVARLEEQAIARSVRHGQTEQVTVSSFVVTESEEEQLYRRTHS